MKVVLIYRKRRGGGYSIEELFSTIRAEVGRHVEVMEYEVGSRWSILRDVRRLRTMRADVYHVTGDIHYLVPLLPARRTVLTVHDINHYLFDLRGIKRWVYRWVWLEWPIRAAGTVTTISNRTLDSVRRHLPTCSRHIDVIENCHGRIFRPVGRPFHQACPVILQVGTLPYKNVPRLLEALRGIRCRLVLVGPLGDELKRKLDECRIDYENRVDLTREEMYRQYIDCDIVSFVSLAEGFGIPIIEAQASGRPVITSNVSPMCEVAGDGACLVDPQNVSQIRAGVLRIMADAVYRGGLVARGLQNVTRYSPPMIGGQYLDLYRRIADPGSRKSRRSSNAGRVGEDE